jgi:hypothetical protein
MSHQIGKNRRRNRLRRFRDTSSRTVKIHFLGTWYGVSSCLSFDSLKMYIYSDENSYVGPIRRRKPSAKCSDQICYFHHALPSGEVRVKTLIEHADLSRNTSEPGPELTSKIFLVKLDLLMELRSESSDHDFRSAAQRYISTGDCGFSCGISQEL